jgi:hypothetical protein
MVPKQEIGHKIANEISPLGSVYLSGLLKQ